MRYPLVDGRVLLVENYVPTLRAHVPEAHRRHLEAIPTMSVADTERALDSVDPHRLRGALVDLRLPDGWSFDLIRRLKRGFPKAVVAVCTGYKDQRPVVEAIGVAMIDKGDATAINKFWEGAVIAASKGELSIDQAVAAVCNRFKLSDDNIRLVTLVACGDLNAELSAKLEVETRGLESRLRRMPSDAPRSIDSLVRLILRVAHSGPRALEETHVKHRRDLTG